MLCLDCVVEQMQDPREAASPVNEAAVVYDGDGLCMDHLLARRRAKFGDEVVQEAEESEDEGGS